MSNSRPNGYILYDGPSKIDTRPIVAISTGFVSPSDNPKTGPMIQLWIIRSDVHPATAAVNGDDFSICGDCPLRTEMTEKGKQERLCYVNPFQAPRAVYTSFKEKKYPYLTSLEHITEIHAGRRVRLGAYGDPIAVPFEVIAASVAKVNRHTGYTHQWDKCDQRFRRLLMASVDTMEQFERAKALGWRTFRTRSEAAVDVLAGSLDAKFGLAPDEIVCPASPEADHRTTCFDCTLCNGSQPYARGDIVFVDRRKNIAILPHGKGTSAFAHRMLRMANTS